MGELGHHTCSTEALITKRANCRYLFQKEESKRRITTPIFENAAKGSASGEDCTYYSTAWDESEGQQLRMEMCMIK
jgi:hypothetical protein